MTSPIRVKVRLKHTGKRVEEHMEKVRDKWLSEVSAATISIARKSMRPAPKRKSAPLYDEKVVTTFKSGKRQGQRREYVRRGQFSAPGQPPRYRAKERHKSLKNMSSARMSKEEMIAGPLKFNSYGNRTTNQPIPHVHEFGGTFIRTQKFGARRKRKSSLGAPRTGSDWQRILAAKKKPSSDRLPSKTITGPVSYPQRPYMKPAHEKAIEWLRRNGSRLARSV